MSSQTENWPVIGQTDALRAYDLYTFVNGTTLSGSIQYTISGSGINPYSFISPIHPFEARGITIIPYDFTVEPSSNRVARRS